ncbi:MAG: hypothetical protein JNJ58_12400 [Chitinophagaceae bacterium]|nr:hypothetical protein [Chitinophagaceae bacterium]
MNITQRQNILNSIEQIEQLDLIELLNGQHPNEGDATKIIIGNFNAAQLIQLILRIISQLKTELNDGLGMLLPQSQNFQNDFGTVNLESDLTNLHSWLSSGDFNSASTRVESLIYYQIINGFWDKTRTKTDTTKTETEKLLKELNVIQGKLNGFIDRNATLVQNLEKATSDVTVFLELKRQEFTTLTENQNTSTTTLQSINEVLTRATSIEGELKTLLKNQTDSATVVEKNIETNQNDFDTLNLELTNLQKLLTETLGTAKTDLKTIVDSKTEVENRITEAKRLLGLSADAALGGKFSLREGKVSKSLIWWRVAVGVSVAVAVAWSVVVFLCLATKTSLPYLDIIVNLVKTSPGFILMGYIMAQYNKERAIEEEYAFRSAISETINAYADLLAGHDGKDSVNASRQAMLLDAIKQVYAKPQMHKEADPKSFYKNSSKELLEVLRDIAKK